MANVRIAWDSSVLLALLEQEQGRYEVLKQQIERADAGEFDITISQLAACESGRIDRIDDPDDQEAEITDFLIQPYVIPVQIDDEVARIARQIVRDYPSIRGVVKGIPGADAVHVASAIRATASVLYCYDKPHLLKYTGQIEGLPIEEPTWKNKQPPLIEPSEQTNPQK